ncbi:MULTISPECIES: hypothetical protein [Spirosoma]|uniref:Uncharacterized protein n=1 Tax=Spirosoma sordidisoli TaxID=2502893 RepID=A0A4Q2UP73_9BACT|nr:MULTISPECIES: hypothetical protein [Spirosoma]RYC71517.1 hypothetical protein EQG79_05090 [Spirosoma sordidisoli]
MKNEDNAVCLLAGKGDATAKDICRSLAKEGISAVVKQKESVPTETVDPIKHWSGQPGKDLFFNGWKLMF